jgi:hypothetical protein
MQWERWFNAGKHHPTELLRSELKRWRAVSYPYVSVIKRALSALVDFANRIITNSRDKDFTGVIILFSVFSVGGIFCGRADLVPASTCPSPNKGGERTEVSFSDGTCVRDFSLPLMAAGSTPQRTACLRSMRRRRPRRSATETRIPNINGPLKPKRLYKAPPTGGPIRSLEFSWQSKI